MRNTVLVLMIIGFMLFASNGFALLAPAILTVPAHTDTPMTPAEECAMWGHYRCICTPEIVQAERDCAAWGHYRCICPRSNY